MSVSEDMHFATEGQRIKDVAFLEAVKREYVVPLLDELEDAVPGFSDMDADARFYSLVSLNQFGSGKVGGALLQGDSLVLDFDPFGDTDRWAVVYAGRLAYDGLIERNGHEFYRPAFISSPVTGVSVPQRIRKRDPFFYNMDIGTYLRECHDHYSVLHPSYRVALLAQYVCENIVCLPAEAAMWCAGCYDLRPRRFIANNVASENGQAAGWWFRVRDSYIPVDFGKAIIQRCREATELFADMPFRLDEEHATAIDDAIREKPRRATWDKTDTMVVFIDGLIDQGVRERCRTERRSFWKLALDLLFEAHPEVACRYTSHTSLAESYHKAKNRKEER